MASLVVFDSYFGNTEIVARAVAEMLAAAGPVRTLRVEQFEPGHLHEVGLVVVGSPTRAFRPSPGIQAWLAKVPPGQLEGVRVAAFDTRVDVASSGNPLLSSMARWFGYAAPPIEKRLLQLGGSLAGPAEGFVVEDKMGPLREGETDRARAWARALADG